MWQRLGSRKISWDFAVLGKVIKKRGRFMVFDSSGGDRWVAVICLMLITSKPARQIYFLQGCCVAAGISSPSCFFFGFGVERVIGQVIGVEVGFQGLEIRHASRDDCGSVSSATELKIFFGHILQLLLLLNHVSGRP
jgi:hypothetical protein